MKRLKKTRACRPPSLLQLLKESREELKESREEVVSKCTLKKIPFDRIAEQLALMAHDLLSRVRPRELMKVAWQKHKDLAPNVLRCAHAYLRTLMYLCSKTRYVDFTEHVSYMVVSTIVRATSVEPRAQLLRTWIKVCENFICVCCPFVCASVLPCSRLSARSPVHSPFRSPVHPPVCLSACSSVHPSACSPNLLSVYLSLCLLAFSTHPLDLCALMCMPVCLPTQVCARLCACPRAYVPNCPPAGLSPRVPTYRPAGQPVPARLPAHRPSVRLSI